MQLVDQAMGAEFLDSSGDAEAFEVPAACDQQPLLVGDPGRYHTAVSEQANADHRVQSVLDRVGQALGEVELDRQGGMPGHQRV